jgi:hypothetical protein
MKEDYSTLTAEVPIVVHAFLNKVDLGNSLIKVSYYIQETYNRADVRLD